MTVLLKILQDMVAPLGGVRHLNFQPVGHFPVPLRIDFAGQRLPGSLQTAIARQYATADDLPNDGLSYSVAGAAALAHSVLRIDAAEVTASPMLDRLGNALRELDAIHDELERMRGPVLDLADTMFAA